MIGINHRLWFGPIAALLLLVGVFLIGLTTPDYSHVRQTVSELGEAGSPGRITFSILLTIVATCLIIFAGAIARALRDFGLHASPAYFVWAMAISVAGVGVFAFPHPLHNIFGMSELVGYQAPLVAALASMKDRNARRLRNFSILMYAVVLLGIVANLTTLDRHGDLWLHIQPFYGVVQRLLFAAWFFWCAGYALLLMRMRRRAHNSFKPKPLRGSA